MVNCSCDITALLDVGYTGIISASMSGSFELVRLLTTCEDPNAEKTLKGPSTGNISISCYPYEQGADKFLGVTCPSSAGVSINYTTKHDCENEITYFIMQKGGQAYREGDPITGITIVEDNVCSYRNMNADASSSPYSVYSDKTRYEGYGMQSSLRPIPFDSTIEQTYTILGIEAYLQSYTVEVSLPQGARATYNFMYQIPGC